MKVPAVEARVEGRSTVEDRPWTTLNATRWRTGSQCSCHNTGAMWSLRRAPVTRQVAAFCTCGHLQSVVYNVTSYKTWITDTSNLTTVTEVLRGASACLFPVRGASWWVLLQHYYVAIIFQRRVWHRALSLCYACIRSSGIILIPLPNFYFFHGLHCWSSPRRKIAYSLNRSYPNYLMLREPSNNTKSIVCLSYQFYQVIEVKFNVDNDCLLRITSRPYFSVIAGVVKQIRVEPPLPVRRLCCNNSIIKLVYIVTLQEF